MKLPKWLYKLYYETYPICKVGWVILIFIIIRCMISLLFCSRQHFFTDFSKHLWFGITWEVFIIEKSLTPQRKAVAKPHSKIHELCPSDDSIVSLFLPTLAFLLILAKIYNLGILEKCLSWKSHWPLNSKL